MAWGHLPVEGGFKVAKPGQRGAQRHANDKDKLEQLVRYSKFQRWAREKCDVLDDELRQHLRTARRLERHQRGKHGIPLFMQEKNTDERHHAALLCRVAGMRKAVSIQDFESLGGNVFGAKAAAELARILELRCADVNAECVDVDDKLLRERGFNLQKPVTADYYETGGWVSGLLEIWLRKEGACLM